MILRPLGAAALVALALTGCASPTPAPVPTPSEGTVCDPFLLTGSLNGDLSATATALADPAFPIDRVIASGVAPDCTAHLAVTAADGTTLELDVALVNVPIAELSAQLDQITSAHRWTRDPAHTIWRAPDGGGSVLVLEIEEGSLLCDVDSGEVPQAWLPHG